MSAKEILIQTEAPSNIALIKYMGKKSTEGNVPENPSLSLTLKNRCTRMSFLTAVADQNLPSSAELETIQWVDYPNTLTHVAKQRLENHLRGILSNTKLLLNDFGFETVFIRDLKLRTSNTFPEGAGLASSASSFAAATLALTVGTCATSERFKEFYHSTDADEFKHRLSILSQAGSGSSCRSFFGPWVKWENHGAFAIHAKDFSRVRHFAILLSSEPKQVSSSEAHVRVKSSHLWNSRRERVFSRYQKMQNALLEGNWAEMSALSWDEFMDMHELFHTSVPQFSYWNSETKDAVAYFKVLLREGSFLDTMMVTMDAGPNVHVFVKDVNDEDSSHSEAIKQRLIQKFGIQNILEDVSGCGAEIL